MSTVGGLSMTVTVTVSCAVKLPGNVATAVTMCVPKDSPSSSVMTGPVPMGPSIELVH